MVIEHQPIFNTETVVNHYTEKDGVEVTYVCTTDLTASDVPYDIFFRETPHPDFGNRYFGLANHPISNHLVITNADMVEGFEFGCIVDSKGNYHYSQSHHDYRVIDGCMIDGGRQYTRFSGQVYYFKVKDGVMRMEKFPYEDSGIDGVI